MSNLSLFSINWTHSDLTVHGESCFGNILIQKDTNIAHIFGISGTRKWYPSTSKFLKDDEARLKEIMERLNSYHLSRLKYIIGSWVFQKS